MRKAFHAVAVLARRAWKSRRGRILIIAGAVLAVLISGTAGAVVVRPSLVRLPALSQPAAQGLRGRLPPVPHDLVVALPAPLVGQLLFVPRLAARRPDGLRRLSHDEVVVAVHVPAQARGRAYAHRRGPLQLQRMSHQRVCEPHLLVPRTGRAGRLSASGGRAANTPTSAAHVTDTSVAGPHPPASVPANTCHARALLATRLRNTYTDSPNT